MIVSLTRTPVTGSEGLETCDSDKLPNSDNHGMQCISDFFYTVNGVGGASGVSQNGGLGLRFYVWTLDSWVVFPKLMWSPIYLQ